MSRVLAKVDFACTHLEVDTLKLQGYPKLNEWIQKNVLKCRCIGSGYPDPSDLNPCPEKVQMEYIDNKKYVLVVNYAEFQQPDIFDFMEKQEVRWLNTNIIGFALLEMRPDNNSISIFDVCRTNQDKDSTGEKKRMGKTIFSVILTYIEFSINIITNNNIQKDDESDRVDQWNGDLNPNPTLWLGVKLSNPNFEQISSIYTSFGFKDPYISNHDINNTPYPFYFMSLTRKAAEYIEIHSDTDDVLNEVKYLKDNYTADRVSEISLKLDPACIYRLRTYPYIDIERQGISSADEYNHAEFSGSLSQARNRGSTYDGGKYISNLTFNTIDTRSTGGKSNIVSETVGYAQGVSIKYDPFVWHSHPVNVYHQTGVTPADPTGVRSVAVLIAPPSGQDHLSMIESITSDQLLSTDQSPIRAAFVTTIEGVYCTSFHEEIIPHLLELINILKTNDYTMMRDLLDYPVNLRQYDWTKHQRVGEYTVDKDMVKKMIDGYLNWYDGVQGTLLNYIPSLAGKKLFKVQFRSWKKLFSKDEDSKLFDIHLHNIYGNSFPSSYSKKRISDIHGKEYEDLTTEENIKAAFTQEHPERVKKGGGRKKRSRATKSRATKARVRARARARVRAKTRRRNSHK